MMKHAIGYLLAMLVIAACGTGVDSDPRSTVGTVGSDGGDAASEGTSNPCAGADGPRHDYTTAYELTQLMTGTWVQCTPVSPTLLNGKGLEFLADGTYYLLVSDGHGGLARGTGFASQGAWEVKDIPETGRRDLIILSLEPVPGSYMGDTPLFEDHPRRFAFDPNATGTLVVYQAIGR